MDFEKAVIYAIEQFGREVVGESRFANILSDLNAYSEQPACRYILREIINSRVSLKLINQSSANLAKVFIMQAVQNINKTHGFQKDLIEYILKLIYNATNPSEERIQPPNNIPYEYVGSEDEFGFCDVRKNGKWGFISSDKKVAIPAVYDSVGSFQEGFAYVSKDGKFGFVDTKGEIVIDLIYDNAYSFHSGIAKVYNHGKYGFINTYGEIILPIEYDNISHISGDMIAICKEGLWGFVNLKGYVTIPVQYTKIIKHFSRGYAAVSDGIRTMVININGDIIQYL